MKKTDLIVAIVLVILVSLAITFLAMTRAACKNVASMCENSSFGNCKEVK